MAREKGMECLMDERETKVLYQFSRFNIKVGAGITIIRHTLTSRKLIREMCQVKFT